MPILNYTTSVPAARTVGQIQTTLSKHGASAILSEYDDGRLVALSFKVPTPHGELAFRLPVRPEAVQAVLLREGVDRRYQGLEHAGDVCWRILKDWVEAQMALLQSEMVSMDQLFLPYLMLGQETLYDRVRDRQFLLNAGKSTT